VYIDVRRWMVGR